MAVIDVPRRLLCSLQTGDYWRDVVQKTRETVIVNRRDRRHKDTKAGTHIAMRSISRGFHSREGDSEVRVMTAKEVLAESESDTSCSDSDSECEYVRKDTKPTRHMKDISDRFTLNREQRRAFVLAATSVVARISIAPLRMYLGGDGGTGKSRVVQALVKFFEERGESYRFLVLAPTGSAAANVDGATYHSVLGLGPHAGSMTSAKLAKLRDQLAEVDLILIDEVSMLSCTHLYYISERLSLIFDTPFQAFAGRHVILAGDFAQLPPPGNIDAQPLYSSNVGLRGASGTLSSQRATIGRAQWHFFTTVIILRENMRQHEQSEPDKAFLTALRNMRYKACTPVDIRLLKTRISGLERDRPHIGDPAFCNVSIITGRNKHRDILNKVCSERFATEHGLALTTFFAVDSWASNTKVNESTVKQRRLFKTMVDPVRTSNTMSDAMQNVLWDLRPSDSDHTAGKLHLCLGLPVILKFNEATELCATNGAEATVVGWDADEGDPHHLHLKTLFVKLSNPPRKIQIPGLPENIIPLTSADNDIYCKLPNGSIVHITRKQVQVLPNFAMTDFGSQGRTRLRNPVDLRQCYSHQLIYTALSRCPTLDGVLILHDFEECRVMGGARADIMHEFRKLEILDDITRLRFDGVLPFDVTGQPRDVLVQQYQAWKGLYHIPSGVHLAVQWTNVPGSVLTAPVPAEIWRIIDKGKQPKRKKDDKEQQAAAPTAKRRRSVEQEESEEDVPLADAANNKKHLASFKPVTSVVSDASADVARYVSNSALSTSLGFIWDAVNYSCAYDTTFGLLLNVYREFNVNPCNMTLTSVALHRLYELFDPALQPQAGELERVRDCVCLLLDARAFPPVGPVMVDIDRLLSNLFTLQTAFCSVQNACTACGLQITSSLDLTCSLSLVSSDYIWPDDQRPVIITTEVIMNTLLNRRSARSCACCGAVGTTHRATQFDS